MEVQIKFQRKIPGLEGEKIRQKLGRVLKGLACPDKELSVLFTDDNRISHLNRHYLRKNGPTNVLAFPMEAGPPPRVDSPMLGDVVISVDSALRESREFGEDLEFTIDRLLIHGVLHLMGYDHEKSTGGAKRMEKEEKRLISLIKEG
jgi:rRNA maturation RNase YbeY